MAKKIERKKKKVEEPVTELEYDLGCVIWDDACYFTADFANGAEAPHEPLTLNTGGWIVKQTDKGVTIAMDVNSNGSLRHVTFVPASYIREVIIYGKAKISHKGSFVEFRR